MSIVAVYDRETRELVDKIEVQAQHCVTNYQAMIFWKGITKIDSGETMSAAVQNVFEKFRRLPVLSKFEFRLLMSA
jgi:hypothetical protein